MATPQPPPPKPKKAAPSLSNLNLNNSGANSSSGRILPPPPTSTAPVPLSSTATVTAAAPVVTTTNHNHNHNHNQAAHIPPIPPRSPDISPNQAAPLHHLSHLHQPQIPPRSPDTRSPELHSQQPTTTTTASPSHTTHTPPLPPRPHNSSSSNLNIHNNQQQQQQNHNHNQLHPNSPNSHHSPISNSHQHQQQQQQGGSSSTIVKSNSNSDFLSQVPRPNTMSNPKSATLQPHSNNSNSNNSSNSNTTNQSNVQNKHQTYRKPLPDTPADISRLSLKTQATAPAHQLPPKSGSTLSLVNHQTPTRQAPPMPPTTLQSQKSTPNLSTTASHQQQQQQQQSQGSQQANISITAAEPRDSISVTLIPNESNVQEQFVHPSLEHLAAFTALRDLKAKEILTTERTYCDNMKILVEVFIDPLKAGEGGISKDSATILCSNLSDILLVSIELLNRLEAKLAEWSNTQRIGDVFLTLIPFLKMYTNYTVGYDNVMNIVTECEKNSSFSQFIQRCTEDPRTRKLDLRSYLIQPVQRITRYHMLLDEVLKHTEPDHPDYTDLAKSLAEMKKVTSEANEAIKRSENRAKVLAIQSMFVGDADIVAAHRSYVFEGILTKVCRKACKKRHVFLFSDMLIYGSSIPPKLLLHEKIMLEHCRIEDIPDGDSGGSRALSLNNGAIIVNAFQICSAKKSFVVFADNADMKMQWMLKLTETIESLQSKRSTLKSETGGARAEAPVWVPDETTTECRFCTEGFTLLNRRHHCRNCGELVCGKCSDKKFRLPVTDFKPARVCIICYDKLTANPPVAAAAAAK
ncbi:pleckstrin domain-containing protein [Heterostelium album PN500]|uniref:Pleckstrin domain-containing protein n=1 Tax=Heterostelium pallidum (strain ATCC 26659 / Pp 5 / PN500) TaxID=670386 RepID=D3BG78_HETP5|nr:pleckstrin domain-containing protein [Heterostelium album PN500]EFA79670.1 pleckstrin domain-containing protein [Heterostelium album PN500]|eukprot:XP_020431791.1 pleckstrin domain-containing protein [Heterostelium album PN500]